MQFAATVNQCLSSASKQFKTLWSSPLKIAAVLMLVLACYSSIAEAGGKSKGNEEDIILYNGNIVMRGDKKGGSIIMANQGSNNEEVEFSPSFFGGYGGDMGGFGRRRRR